MTLRELAARSGDSRLLSYVFENGVLSVVLEMDEFDGLVTLRLKADAVRGEDLSRREGIQRTCRIRLDALSDALESEHGLLRPHPVFGKMMEETRAGLSLAYGRRKDEALWLVSFTGYSLLLCALTAEPEGALVHVMESEA